MALAIDDAVAEELREELDVGRLAAAGAGAGELEQRLEHLRALDRVVGQQVSVERRDGDEEVPARAARASRCSSAGSMSMALWRTSVLSLAGQTSTHRPQPVQSSGATWMVELVSPALFALVVGTLRKPAGALCQGRGSKTFMRIAACGQTSEHRPHWMQICGSQIGSCLGDRALLVLGGAGGEGAVDRQGADRQQVALAGDQHAPVTSLTNGGASSGHRRSDLPVARDLRRALRPRAVRQATGRWRRSCARRWPARAFP